MKLTLSVRSFHVPATPLTWAWPPSLPSVPTSRATRVTSSANERSWSTIVLIVSASAATSPFASTVIFCVRSPFATAVMTRAMSRTWVVRFEAMKLTLSVRSFHVPDDALHLGLAAELALGADLAGDAGDLGGERRELVDHRVDRVLQLERSRPSTSTVIFCERSPLATAVVTCGDVAHLAREVDGHEVHVVGEVLPGAGHALDLGLAAELAVGADLARDARDLGGEGRAAGRPSC